MALEGRRLEMRGRVRLRVQRLQHPAVLAPAVDDEVLARSDHEEETPTILVLEREEDRRALGHSAELVRLGVVDRDHAATRALDVVLETLDPSRVRDRMITVLLERGSGDLTGEPLAPVLAEVRHLELGEGSDSAGAPRSFFAGVLNGHVHGPQLIRPRVRVLLLNLVHAPTEQQSETQNTCQQ